jgi:hypothetical protein
MELDPRIRIRAPLRCDGIGRLDCAEDADSGARLAVRWLPLEANGEAAVKACEKLPTHPVLPRIRQTGQVGASAFVALDFPQGELLSAREGERLETELVLRMAGQLADALATVHAQGVVHGEMSADSVLLAQGKAYLWDMPLVIANRLADRRGENRLMQNLVKTAAFLSPERARGEGASQAGDVYALGVVLCVAAGAPLPSGATTLAMVHQVATGAWAPRVPTQLPDAWREVLSRMLASEPSARPSAAEVAKAFAEAPSHTALPTVPEMPAVKLPAELLAVAAEKAKAHAEEELQRAKTREMPLVQLQAVAQAAGALATSALQLEAVEPAPTTDVATARMTHDALADVPEADADADVVRIPTLEMRAVGGELPVVAHVVAAATEPAAVTSSAPVAGPSKPTSGAHAAHVPGAKATSTSGAHAAVVATSSKRSSGAHAAHVPAEKATSTSGAHAAVAAQASSLAQPSLPAVTSVALTDSVSVAPELAASSVTLSADEVDSLHRGRAQVGMLVAGVALALLGVAMVLLVLFVGPAEAPKVVAPVVAPAPVVPPVAQPAPAAVADDELVPLLKLAPAKKPAPKTVAPREAAQPVVPAPAPVLEAKPEAEVAAPAEPVAAEPVAPKAELKRPEL